ncbi:response regulator [Desulfobacter latus]|uniref:histidine kinase n=1 Tax=Desulfobacter latus TaxID=2292 RepID=A0A850TCR8_9BACT|nr:response regulator [Desulfobacter latus]NWH05196.1 response regulator [Desulfobacter latus]
MEQYKQIVIVVKSDESSDLLPDILSGQTFDVMNLKKDDNIPEMVRLAHPDLVLIDVEDSNDFAIELCRSLKASEKTSDVPVIIILMLPEIQDKENAFDAGCYDFITKPYASSELLVRIHNCLLNQMYLKKLEHQVYDRTKELEANKSRFKNIFTSLSIGAVIFEPINNGNDFVIQEFNPAAEKIEKIKMKDVVDRPLTQAFPGVNEFGLLDVFKQVYKNGTPVRHPVSIYKDNRIQGWRENYVIKLPSGEIVALYTDETKQKKAEEKILQHRNFLQKIIDGVNDGLMVINRDYTIAYANKVALETYGHKRLEPTMTCYEVLYAQNAPCSGKGVVCPLKEIIKSRTFEKFEHTYRDSQNRNRSIEISCSPILDENSEVTQMIKLFRDVTEQKRREQRRDALVKLSKLAVGATSKEVTEAFLNEAEKITDSKIGFFHIIDEERSLIKLTACSTNTRKNMCKAKDNTGHYPKEKAGVWADCLRTRNAVIHNDYESLPNKKGLPEGHAPIVRELVVPVLKNDQIVAVLGVGNREYNYLAEDCENVTALADMAWDIISHKQIEEKLQSSEARFSKLFFSSPDATVLLRLSDGNIVDVNVAFEKTFGYERQFCRKKSFLSLKPWLDKEITQFILKELQKGNRVQGLEIQCQRSSGATFDAAISCDTTTIEQEAHLIVIIRDISKRKAAEKEKQALENQLQHARKMESIGTLAGGIAHDFNNILSAIMGYTQLLMASAPDTGEDHQRLNNILTAGRRASDLVSQILTFSRNDVQDLKPLKAQFIVKEALRLLQSSIPATIKIKQNIQNDCGMVLANPTQIHQIIMNSCTNAYHAMKFTGGVLSVSLEQVELSREDIAVKPHLASGPYARISITDNGPGIPKDILDRIFEPYFTTKSKGEGTGLGLATVHGIVTGLKGDITVHSDPGKQTTFQIVLPIVRALEKQAPTTRLKDIPQGNERILLVDDEAFLVDATESILESLGYDVTAMTDSIEAFELFQRSPKAFDLIITDMTMPGMSGDKLAKKIFEITPEIPVILMTGHSDIMNFKKAKAMGIKGYLTKPALRRHLAEEIRRCFGGDSTGMGRNNG